MEVPTPILFVTTILVDVIEVPEATVNSSGPLIVVVASDVLVLIVSFPFENCTNEVPVTVVALV